MSSLSIERTTSDRLEDRSWISPGGIDHGVNLNKSVTLDVTAFDAETHYPDGRILSGTVLGLITGSDKLYGPYDNTATDGRQVARGFLYNSATVKTGVTRIVAPMYRHGAVTEADLPDNSGLDSAAKTDLAGMILFD